MPNWIRFRPSAGNWLGLPVKPPRAARSVKVGKAVDWSFTRGMVVAVDAGARWIGCRETRGAVSTRVVVDGTGRLGAGCRVTARGEDADGCLGAGRETLVGREMGALDIVVGRDERETDGARETADGALRGATLAGAAPRLAVDRPELGAERIGADLMDPAERPPLPPPPRWAKASPAEKTVPSAAMSTQHDLRLALIIMA